jgi:flagellar biosynthesis protein FlhB
MAGASDELNKSEEATPFKLERARRKGTVARGNDLGFFTMLAGLALALQLFGPAIAGDGAQLLRLSFSSGIASAVDPAAALQFAGRAARAILRPVVMISGVVAIVVLLAELIQLRGLIIAADPLKPDFSRLSPAKGLKRLFSLRMLIETAKSSLKMTLYAAAAYWLVGRIVAAQGMRASDGGQLAEVMAGAANQLLATLIVLAGAFALLDQMLVRRDFRKQMRMSRSEVTRDAREREGDPRQKQKRRQLHGDYAQQQQAARDVAGSDVLIVNPQHYAVALQYRPDTTSAPLIKARGRNAFALAMRSEARRLGIVIIENPVLARRLYRSSVGALIPTSAFGAVADIYIMLGRRRRVEGPGNAA